MSTVAKNPVVSVILVSYNTREHTLKGLAAVKSATTVPIEIIVVDNASTDNSADAITYAFPDIDVVAVPLGVGIEGRARGQWLLTINPDTEPIGDPIGRLVDYAERHPRHRIYTGRTLRADLTDDGLSVHALPSLWGYVCFATTLSSVFRRSGRFNPLALPYLDRTAGGPVPAVSGCLMLVEKELWRELGGFAPEYFMYSEDIDLCARARALGARPVLVPQAQLVHVGGAASSGAEKRVMVLRGMATYVRLRWSPRRARAARGLLATGVLVRAAGRASWRGAWHQRSVWLPGWPTPTKEGTPINGK